MQERRADSRPFTPSEEGLRMALAAAHAAIWEWRLDTDENMWSEEMWLLFGLPPDTPPSFKAWLASVHPEDQARTSDAVVAAAQAWQPFEVEWRTHPDNGPVRWLLSRGQPGQALQDAGGTYTGIVVDITTRKETEAAVLRLTETLEERVRQRTRALSEHERLLQNILDGVPGLIGYWTRDLLNRFANKAYCDWFGMSPDAIRNRHIKELLGPELYEQNQPFICAALEGRRQRFERQLPIPGRSGAFRHSETHYLPDTIHGQVQGFLVIVFDISQVKEAELAAEAASQAKSDFLANISHEVRTPLNAMFGLAQVGARQATGTPMVRTFEQILESAQHLLSLVNDVLDFSKIESGKLTLHYERIDLGQVLEHVLTLKAIRAQAKGLSLTVHESARVPQYFLGDATRIAQILFNLLSNAIKFTDQGEVRVTLDFDAPDLLIRVQDTGMGMSPDKLARLFQPFMQVHDHQSAQTAGTGLGLAITRRLVDMMRGRIDVGSEAGQGSTFSIKLPLLHPEAARLDGLREVLFVGGPTPAGDALADSLAARGIVVQRLTTCPPAPHGNAQLVLIDSDSLHGCAATFITRCLDEGRIVLVNTPASTALDLPKGVHSELPVIAGPLSPLRLLTAIKTRLSRPAVANAQRLQGIRVLAAEDNPVNRLVLQQMLEQEGAIVTFAFDGAHALEQVRVQGAASFDIVLCDIQMPVLDGYETAQALGHIAPGLPIIGLTAHAFETAKQQARKAGMVGYVTKPYMLDTLVEEIRRFARRKPTDAAPVWPTAALSVSASPGTQDLSDWEAMQQYYQAQPQLLRKLVAMLNDTLSPLLAELDQAIAKLDMEALAKVAHNIKGTALNLHTPELARLALQVQETVKEAPDRGVAAGQALAASLGGFIAQAAPRPDEPPR